MNWAWPQIGCWIIFGIMTGAGIGLAIEGEWGAAFVFVMVAVFAAIGASLLND